MIQEPWLTDPDAWFLRGIDSEMIELINKFPVVQSNKFSMNAKIINGKRYNAEAADLIRSKSYSNPSVAIKNYFNKFTEYLKTIDLDKNILYWQVVPHLDSMIYPDFNDGTKYRVTSRVLIIPK